jgi:ATP-dependent Clp protease ATP-binding subunit ClpB
MAESDVSVVVRLPATVKLPDKVATLMKDVGFDRAGLIKAIKELRGGASVKDQNAEAKEDSQESHREEGWCRGYTWHKN